MKCPIPQKSQNRQITAAGTDDAGLPCFPIMTRLLVLTELFLPTKGGTAVWAAEVYRRLGGKEIHIVTADVAGAAAVDETHPNTIHRLSLRRVAWLRPESLAMYARFFFRSTSTGTFSALVPAGAM